MLGSRLARRIVFPVLVLIGALFALLGWAALRAADTRVHKELQEVADRVAVTLDELSTAPAGRPELGSPKLPPAILPALAKLVRAEIVVDGSASHPGWTKQEIAGVRPGLAALGGAEYRVLERRAARRPGRYYILTAQERIAARRRAVILPVLWTGAIGLLFAVVLGLVVARTIARPVKRLADQAQRFAAGEQDAGAGPRGPGEIGELQDAFERMVKALRESERFATLGRLAGGIAHELRNPLTAIRMAVEMATDDDSEARAIAVGEIERLDRTLREMLDYVRPRKPRLGAVAVAGLFEEVAGLLGPQCKHLRVKLVAQAPDGLVVRADKDRLKQALLNLVLNAAQAQPEGGAVHLTAADRTIVVRDEGPGIPEEVRESLLQPFVTTKEAGIGLGLAVVKQVADEHHARLDFRTGAMGTTFTLRLPE